MNRFQFNRLVRGKMRSNTLMFSAGLLLGGGLMAFYYHSIHPIPSTTLPSSSSSSSSNMKSSSSSSASILKSNQIQSTHHYKESRHVPFIPKDQGLIPNPESLTSRHLKIMQFGLPNPTQLQLKQNFISLIDHRLKEPIWVMEHLTNETLMGDADRVHASFKQDEDVLPMYRATNKDYMKSGYSRGHMSPASNNKVSPEAMAESFLLNSNIVPQELDNNMYYWSRMENWVRKLVRERGFEQVHVISGPLFLPSNDSLSSFSSTSTSSTRSTLIVNAPDASSSSSMVSSNSPSPHPPPPPPPVPESAILLPPPSDVYSSPPTSPPPTSPLLPGKPFRYMAYKLIGENQIAVPTHLFKAVLATIGTQHYFACFIVPNTPVAEHLPLHVFQVPKPILEKYSGFVLFDKVNTFLDLCATKDKKGNLCDLGSPEEYQFMIFEKKLQKAQSKDHLDQVYKDLNQFVQQRRQSIPSNLIQLYEQRKRNAK